MSGFYISLDFNRNRSALGLSWCADKNQRAIVECDRIGKLMNKLSANERHARAFNAAQVIAEEHGAKRGADDADEEIRACLEQKEYRKAFHLIVQHYSTNISGLSYSMLGDRGHVEEISQDVLLRIGVTRKGVHIDRIASAWLIRRFIDSSGRFKFVSAKAIGPNKTSRFDMFDANSLTKVISARSRFFFSASTLTTGHCRELRVKSRVFQRRLKRHGNPAVLAIPLGKYFSNGKDTDRVAWT